MVGVNALSVNHYYTCRQGYSVQLRLSVCLSAH